MPIVALLPAIITAGGAIAGGAIAAHGQTSASNTQAESSREGLDFLKGAYADRQRQLAPYIGVGSASASTLGSLMGLDTSAGAGSSSGTIGATPGGSPQAVRHDPSSPQQQQAVQAVQSVFQQPGSAFDHFNQIRSLGTMSGGIRVKSPNGQVGIVPESRLQEALAAGGQRVS